MKHLDLTVFEPTEIVATVATDGTVTIWTVQADGSLVAKNLNVNGNGTRRVDEKLPLEEFDPRLTTRTYNILKREGVHTAGQLLEFYVRVPGLDTVRGMTPASNEEIRTTVEKMRGGL